MKTLLVALFLSLTTFAHTAKADCSLGMIVFVQGGIASSTNGRVLTIRDAFESKFGGNYTITVVDSGSELSGFDYALAMTIDNSSGYLTVNARDVGLNKVLRTEQELFAGRNYATVLDSLADKVNRNVIKKGLFGSCK